MNTGPVLDATTQAFVEALTSEGRRPTHLLSYDEARNVLVETQSGLIAVSSATIEDHVFPVGPTGSVGVRLLRPEEEDDLLPAIVYCHGGGWVTGDKDTHDRLVRALANAVRAVVIFVEYIRAPDARYPTQNEQAYAVLEYVWHQSAALGIDACRIAVAGDGTGGTMAAALSLMAKVRRGPNIVYQVLFYPVMSEVTASAMFEEGPWLTKNALAYYFDAYFPDAASRAQITAFPLLASPEQLNDLPEALIIVAENDIVRDDGEAYGRKLIAGGVTVTSTRYNGTIHDFVMLNALAESAPARAAISQAIAALRNAFYSSP